MPFSPDQEPRLIDQAKHGDAVALGQLVGEYDPALKAKISSGPPPSIGVDAMARAVWEYVGHWIQRPVESGGFDPAKTFVEWATVKCLAQVIVNQLAEKARDPLDKVAFNALVKKYDRKLIIHLLLMTNAPDYDVDDMRQNVWIRVQKKIHRQPADGGFDWRRGSFINWVKRCHAWWEILEWWAMHGSDPLLSDGDSGVFTDADLDLEAYEELHRLTFLCGGYPHQQFAFMFSRVLYGAGTGRVRGDSTMAAVLHGNTSLDHLAVDYLKRYADQSAIANPGRLTRLSAHLDPVRARNRRKIPDLFLHASDQRVDGDPTRDVGQTCLTDYATQAGLRNSIQDWSNKVRMRLKALLGLRENGDDGDIAAVRQTCRFRHVPPCLDQPGNCPWLAREDGTA